MLPAASRTFARSFCSSLGLLLVASAASGQTPPGAQPAPAGSTAAAGPSGTPPATPSAAAPGSDAATAPAAPSPTPEPPKSRTQIELEARLNAMRSGKGLTADEAARRSVRNSATIEAKTHALEGVDAQLEHTKYAFWPKVKLSASYTRLSPVHPKFDTGAAPTDPALAPIVGAITQAFSSFENIPVNSWSLDGQLSVPLSDYLLRVSHAVSGATRAREAAIYDRGATSASVDRDARVAYYTWVRAHSQEIIAAQSLEQAEGHLKDAENAFQAGLVSKADVLGAQANVKNAELFVEHTHNQVELAELALRVAMGDAPERHYEIGEDVFAPTPELDSLPTSAAALREATDRRMELKSLKAAEQASRDQATLERVADYPRLDGQAGITYANPNQRYFPLQQKWNLTWQAGVSLSWTPTDIGLGETARDTALAKAKELAAQRRAVEDGLKIEIEQALKAAEEARYTIDVSSHSLAAADESYRVRRELFRAGRATLVEVTDAETELTRARLQLTDAYVNARIALAELHHALGRDTGAAKMAAR